MKFFAAIFLFTVIVIQTFSSYMMEADFYFNQDFIAKNLCVNRDKPMMHCNGKCYLSKKLKEEGKTQSPVSKTERLDVSPYFVPASYSSIDILCLNSTKYFNKDDNIISSFSSFIFHPPAA